MLKSRRISVVAIVIAAILGMGFRIVWGIVIEAMFYAVCGAIWGVIVVSITKLPAGSEPLDFWAVVQYGIGVGATIGLIFASVRLFQKAKDFPSTAEP